MVVSEGFIYPLVVFSCNRNIETASMSGPFKDYRNEMVNMADALYTHYIFGNQGVNIISQCPSNHSTTLTFNYIMSVVKIVQPHSTYM